MFKCGSDEKETVNLDRGGKLAGNIIVRRPNRCFVKKELKTPLTTGHLCYSNALLRAEIYLIHHILSILSTMSREDNQSDAIYNSHILKSPVLYGFPLRLFVNFMETEASAPLRRLLIARNGLYPALEDVDLHSLSPTFSPNTKDWNTTSDQRPTFTIPSSPAHALQEASKLIKSGNIYNIHQSYLSGKTTPLVVANKVIHALQQADDKDNMCIMASYNTQSILQQAAASTERYTQSDPLSILDGIPFAVKDLVDVVGYPTKGGTSFLADKRPVTTTNPAVQSLINAGCNVIGKTNTHEIGIGITGLNTVAGTPKNPHCAGCHTGGSSSGSAALVASGICPIAVGTDGGGSIRIPSSLCGIVGLKTTHDVLVRDGHRSETVVSLAPSVSVMGPMAGTVSDALLMYIGMRSSRKDGNENNNKEVDSIELPNILRLSSQQPLKGLTAGIYWPWFEDCDAEVLAKCKAAVKVLQDTLGLSIVDITLPDLDLLRTAHAVTIASEMRSFMSPLALNDTTLRQSLNLETRATLLVAAGFTGAHYIQAQKIRTKVENNIRGILSCTTAINFIITPTTPVTAPAIQPQTLTGGLIDLNQTSTIMRFTTLANFIGLPSISVPVGKCCRSVGGVGGVGGDGNSNKERRSMPVGLQIMAAPYQEASLFYAALALETALNLDTTPQDVHYHNDIYTY